MPRAYAKDRLNGVVAATRETAFGTLAHVTGGGATAYHVDPHLHVVAGVRAGDEVAELLVHLLQARLARGTELAETRGLARDAVDCGAALDEANVAGGAGLGGARQVVHRARHAREPLDSVGDAPVLPAVSALRVHADAVAH